MTVSVHNASQAVQVLGSSVTFWGVPGDPRHDSVARLGSASALEAVQRRRTCEPVTQPRATSAVPDAAHPVRRPLTTTWKAKRGTARSLQENGGESTSSEVHVGSRSWSGCDRAAVRTRRSKYKPAARKHASTPTGMKVNVSMPQQRTLEAEARRRRTSKRRRSSCPKACRRAPARPTACRRVRRRRSASRLGATLEPFLEGRSSQHTSLHAGTRRCARTRRRSGTVDIKTPLLEEELRARLSRPQDTNPFASLLALYIVAEEQKSKVLVKLAGEVHDQRTDRSADLDLQEHAAGRRSKPHTAPVRRRARLAGDAGATAAPTTTTATFTPWSGRVQPADANRAPTSRSPRARAAPPARARPAAVRPEPAGRLAPTRRPAPSRRSR